MTAPLEVNRTEEYLIVCAVRESAGKIGKHISESTKRDYAAKFARMISTGYLPEHAGTKRAYYAYRAALLYGASLETKEALRTRDKASYGSAQWQVAMATLRRCQVIYIRYPPDCSKSHHKSGSSSFTWSDVKEQRCPSRNPSLIHSKKSMLPKLRRIESWREKLFNCVTSSHKDATAVIALTGARPSEVARGVTVAVEETGNGQRLLISIQGTKLTATTGQPLRVMRIRIDCLEARHLLMRIQACASTSMTVTTNPVNLCAAIIRAGRRAFPNLKGSVSPYVLRHAMASSLKHAGVGPVQLAQVLGHQATETQQYYGYAVCASDSSPIESVRASVAVRVTHRRGRPAIENAYAVKKPALRPA